MTLHTSTEKKTVLENKRNPLIKIGGLLINNIAGQLTTTKAGTNLEYNKLPLKLQTSDKTLYCQKVV
jgi:hypothetical protein